MARPLRISFPGAIYHVMNRGISRGVIFPNPGPDRALFKDVLGKAVSDHGAVIHAYSLMPNHYHLLVETPRANISRFMQTVDGLYTQRLNKRHGRDGPLIRGRFKSILVEKQSYFLELVRYIHLNGARAGLFSSPRRDLHGSHRDYLNPQTAPAWLERAVVLSYFQSEGRTPEMALDDFVEEGVPKELEKTLARKKWPAILGAREFIETLRNRVRNLSVSKDVPQGRILRRGSSRDPHELVEAVLSRFEERTGTPHVTRETRWTLFTALRNYAHLTYQEIALLLGVGSYDAVEKFLKRNKGAGGGPQGREILREVEMSNVEI